MIVKSMSLEKAKQLYAEGKNEEAFHAFRQELATQPEKADFYTSFAKLLMDINQMPTAQKMVDMATKMQGVGVDTWLTRGQIYTRLQSVESAKQSFEEALKLDRNHENTALNQAYGTLLKDNLYDYQQAIGFLEMAEKTASNLSAIGLCYRELLDDATAEEYFIKAIEENKLFAPVYVYYLNLLLDKSRFDDFYQLHQKYYDENLRHTSVMDILNVGKVLCLYLENRIDEMEGVLEGSPFYTDSSWNNFEFKFVNILIAYRRYLLEVLAYRKENKLYDGEYAGKIHVIGDSHTLSYAWLTACNKLMVPHLIQGMKIRHTIVKEENHYRNTLKEILLGLEDGAAAILNIGEIDCRDGEGFLPYLLKNLQENPQQFVEKSVKQYVDYIKEAIGNKDIHITFSGVPAPKSSNLTGEKERQLRLDIIKTLNTVLEQRATEGGFQFISAYAPQKDGFGAEGAFIDDVHLKPEVYAEIIETTKGAAA
jgi:tetratricopeptide (TPR) repeat protein